MAEQPNLHAIISAWMRRETTTIFPVSKIMHVTREKFSIQWLRASVVCQSTFPLFSAPMLMHGRHDCSNNPQPQQTLGCSLRACPATLDVILQNEVCRKTLDFAEHEASRYCGGARPTATSPMTSSTESGKLKMKRFFVHGVRRAPTEMI